MNFNKILLDNTNLPQELINIILNYKKNLDNIDNIDKYFGDIQNVDNLFINDDIITLHDFIYYLKYYDNKKYKNVSFKINIIYVDDYDYDYKLMNDNLFQNNLHKIYKYDDIIELLYFKIKHLYILKTHSLNDYYINSKDLILSIRLYDPHYQALRKNKKYKKYKKIKKFFYNLKNIFNF